jgi:hypothetical protein
MNAKDGAINRWSDPEQRERQAEAARKRWADPAYRARQAEAQAQSLEQKSESLKKKWQDPEFRAKQKAASVKRSEGMKERRNSPEFKTRLRESFKTPEYRSQLSARRSELNKLNWQKPEYKAKQAEATRRNWADPEFRKRALRTDYAKGPANPSFKHGMHGTPEYHSFCGAKNRCRNPNTPKWTDYGGRGIRFLFNSFNEFIEALKTPENPSGLRPSPAHSLDRIDNDWHYGVRPDGTSNIRWATKQEQVANRRPYSTFVCGGCGAVLVCENCRPQNAHAFGAEPIDELVDGPIEGISAC